MAKFEDIKLNDIITIEFNGSKANFKVLVINQNPMLSRIEIIGPAEGDVSHINNLLSLSGSVIANNVKRIEEYHKKQGTTNNIEYVSGLEKYSELYIFYSSEENTKITNINQTNRIVINKLNDFLACKKCKDPVYMAGPNQSDGSFICYSCRSNPIRIYY